MDGSRSLGRLDRRITMKRSLILLSLLVALIPSSAGSWGVMGMSGSAAAAGCSEGSNHLIVGADASDNGGLDGGDILVLGRHQAAHTCVIDKIVIRIHDTNGAGTHVRAAIYADDGSGYPTGAPLASTVEVDTTEADGNDEDLTAALSSEVSIESGTYYWIGYGSSASTLPEWSNVANNGFYQSWTYSSTGALPTISGSNRWLYRIDSWGSSK